MNINSVYFVFLLQAFQAIIVLAAKDTKVCFDVLDKLPRDEVINIYFMQFDEVAHTHPASDILSCFLRASHPLDKSLAEQYFDVYKKCDYYAATNFKPFGKQQLAELVSLGLPYNLEIDLRKKMQTGGIKELKEGITHVQVALSNEIVLSGDFKSYKRIIFRKIDRPNIQKVGH